MKVVSSSSADAGPGKHVVHLCSYYPTSAIYAELTAALVPLLRGQTLMSPRLLGARLPPPGVAVHAAQLWTRADRLWFGRKIARYVSFAKRCESLGSADVLHAHTMFSDGFAAAELARELGVPYVVSVRNTDVNLFARLFLHLRGRAKNVLGGASRVVFANHVYRRQLESLLSCTLPDDIVDVIPNGIASHWLADPARAGTRSSSRRGETTVVCVGEISRGKNQGILVAAVDELNRRSGGGRYRLVIVGAPKNAWGRRFVAKDHGPTVRFTGALAPEAVRRELEEADVFAMLSREENFGLVYVEALACGLPVVYTSNQGFDGWVGDPRWGLGRPSHDVAAVADAIERLAAYGPRPALPASWFDTFRWENIADQFVKHYESAR